ncbi:hypothetical protein [Rugamonas apoptosis]|uniref:Uncharacterized protein n=1 Tax=Rugamonas apoptosis TaxID=2758570 RepID=A0A7W2F701_9BURK|nr:hypothetical protein [Rugamonas apoptosis]MBA5686323.1 hypothetical protein [Rugamonas apoptosis]
MEIKLPERSRDAFEMLLKKSDEMLQEAMHAPVREVVAVENPSGGFEIRTQLIQPRFFRRAK